MRNNFVNLLNQPVVIPIIQRDFAQGRTDSKTTKIREDFLNVLFDRIHERIENPSFSALELDFVYGFKNVPESQVGAFVPIDGQQRLTTLWLLYWYVGVREEVAEDQMAWLKNFGYETRHSTSVFCKHLLDFRPGAVQGRMSALIKDRHWYIDTWEFDSGIQAMLVMIDAIAQRYDALGSSGVWGIIAGEKCPFYFYQLDMGQVGLTDDLYIKMNSRGKALTEFEYFKAGFSEILGDPEQKERFGLSIDQNWIEMVWTLVESSGNAGRGDIATKVDQCFLNLFNFITHILARETDVAYRDTVDSAASLKTIYSEPGHQEFLFEVLDAIHRQQHEDPGFWDRIFYYGKRDGTTAGTRLFFQHGKVNLLERCLDNSISRYSGFPMAEQLLLYACIVHLIYQVDDFEDRIRVVRNLVVNSDNEIRYESLGLSFQEVEEFMLSGSLSHFKNFKTDQIKEEINKQAFLLAHPDAKTALCQLENCDVFRGSISIFELDECFVGRANSFLVHFGEVGWDDWHTFSLRSNFLLCFGDYSQYAYDRTNLMASSLSIVRDFFTTPGYNKSHLLGKTKKVLAEGLDYLVANPSATLSDKLQDQLKEYESAPKDWRYYFIRYASFRGWCNQGYYDWSYYPYPRYRMKEWKKTGYHWNPFLYELNEGACSEQMELENFGAPLFWWRGESAVWINASPNGFVIENGNAPGAPNAWLEELIRDGHVNEKGEFAVQQTADGIDLEDRIEKLRQVLCVNHVGNSQP